MPDVNISPEEILKLEFEYARETAAEAQNDRTTIVNLYLLLVGGISSITLALPSTTSGITLPRAAYVVIFFLLGIAGFFTVFKLIRLRQAWYESVRAMNTIKKFYLEHFPLLDPAFLWKPGTIPSRGKPWTITFNLMLLVAIVDSIAIAAAVHLTGTRVPLGDYVVDAFAAGIFFLWQLWFYFFELPISEK